MKVNKNLIAVKLVYFLYISTLSVFMPYLGLYMFELGLNPFQVGILRCLEPATFLLISPIWGAIADKLQARKHLLVTCVIGLSLSVPMLLFISPVEMNDDQSKSNYSNSNKNELSFTDGTPSDDEEVEDDNIFPANSLRVFYLTGAVCLVFDVFIAGFIPLIDAHTMDMVQQVPGATYGGQRWTGPLAVIVFSPVVGLLTDWFKVSGIVLGQCYCLQSSYMPSFLLFAILCLTPLAPLIAMTNALQGAEPSSFSRKLLTIFREFHVVLTFAVVAICGACRGVKVAFLFLFLDESLDAPQLLISLTLVVSCVVEIPCMYYSRAISKRLGHEAVFCLSMLGYVIRMFCYSVVDNSWMILPVEMLHGVCFGLLWPSCTEFANSIAPEGMSSTLQSLIHAAKAGVGEVIGIAIGGLIYKLHGARALFRGTAALTGIALILYMTDCLRLRWWDRKKRRRRTSDENGKDGKELETFLT